MPPLPRPVAVLIAGPTASGKSALALALAERLGGMIVNADSMQVYRELAMLTARPGPDELARAPHRLYGHVAAAVAYSVARWCEDVTAVLAEARKAGRLPILVGGTGLYFKALLAGLSPVPPIPDEVRARWRAAGDAHAPAELHRALAARDPETASRLAPTDRQRIVRALEVLEATGRSLADWQREPGTPVVDEARTLRLVLAPDRETLRARCDARLDAMIRGGALEEVAALARLGLDSGLPAMRALGVAPLSAHLAGALDLETAMSQAKAETRQYAKRQMTWLRRNMIAWDWVSLQETERKTAKIISFIDG